MGVPRFVLGRHRISATSGGGVLGPNIETNPDGAFNASPYTTTGYTVTGDRNQSDPFGGSIASQLTMTAGNIQHYFFDGVTFVPPGTWFASFYGKAGTLNFIGIELAHTLGLVTFNVSAGSVSSTSGNATGSSIVNAGSGWWLCSSYFNLSATGGIQIGFGDTAPDSQPQIAWTAAGTETISLVRLVIRQLL